MLRLSADTTTNDFQSFLDQVADWADEDGEDALAEAKALPLNPDAVWVVATQAMPGLLPPSEGLPVVVLLIDANTGQIIYNEVLADPTPEDIVDVVLSAMLEPMNEQTGPQRPGRLLGVDAELVAVLARELAGLGIEVLLAEVPELAGLLAELKDVMSAAGSFTDSPAQPCAALTDQTDEDVRALVAAFDRWMKAEPWQIFVPNKPLYVRWVNPDGTPGQCYATVMGELGEVYGLALYPTWSSFAGHLNNDFDPELTLLATGGLESLTSSPGDQMHPEDWARLKASGLPKNAKAGPELMRYGTGGPEAPLTPLRPLIALLNLMAARAESKRNRVTSLKAEQEGVKVLFPAGPRDELTPEDHKGSIELRLHMNSPYGFQGEIVLVGPPDLHLRQAFAEARRRIGEGRANQERIFLPLRLESPKHQSSQGNIFGPLRLRIWESVPQAPHLTLVHLLEHRNLTDSLGSTLEIRRLPHPVDSLTVEVRPRATDGSRE